MLALKFGHHEGNEQMAERRWTDHGHSCIRRVSELHTLWDIRIVIII
jgi:hypothetical protein